MKISLGVLAVSLFVLSVEVHAGTDRYVFLADQSTVTQTGGFAGVNEIYAVEGQFQLTVDVEQGTASFDQTDAVLVGDSAFHPGVSLGELFNMAELEATVVNSTTVDFAGITADGTESEVSIRLIIHDEIVQLAGSILPPDDTADLYTFELDAVARCKYAGGTGRSDNPYRIVTVEDLEAINDFREDWNSHFVLLNDLDLDPSLPGRQVYTDAVVAHDANDARPFNGAFDGGRHIVTNLTIETADESYVALFSRTGPDANIHDLGLEDLAVSGASYTGGLAGLNAGVIDDCYVAGTISGSWFVGGLVGQNAGSIRDSHVSGEIVGDYPAGFLGGLAGFSDGVISNCYARGEIYAGDQAADLGGLVGDNAGIVMACSATCDVSGGDETRHLGGLIGYNACGGQISRCRADGAVVGGDRSVGLGGLIGDDGGGHIAMSFATGSVSAGFQNSGVGGISGGNAGTITDCLARGAVSAGACSVYVGGFLGHNTNSVARSYSVGRVSVGNSSRLVGGLCGSNDGDIVAAAWDTETSGHKSSAGGQGMPTAELQVAAAYLALGWDLTGEIDNGVADLWWISEGTDYPRLFWDLPSDDFADGDPAPLWQIYEPEPEKIRVVEMNGRFEVLATGQGDNIEAGYISNGWRLDVAEDFCVQVDFHFGKRTAGDSWVMLTLLPSLGDLTRYVEIEAGCMNNEPFHLYEVVDGPSITQESISRTADDGTLYMSYDAAADELYLSNTGYGEAEAWQIIAGLLGDAWAGEPVHVAIGGGSDRVILQSGQAHLDDFAVTAGTVR